VTSVNVEIVNMQTSTGYAVQHTFSKKVGRLGKKGIYSHIPWKNKIATTSSTVT
jgi:hypothetical protein